MSNHVLLGVTGSIAAYKSAEIVRLIRKKSWEVSVIMTKAASEFIGELTLRVLSRNPVMIEMFSDSEQWCPEHISLSDRADVMLIAPCTANVIAKLAHGVADDLLTCTALSLKCPLIIAPAMNERMWNNPATLSNVEILKSRGVNVLQVEEGDLACGRYGCGRMTTEVVIISTIESCLEKIEQELGNE